MAPTAVIAGVGPGLGESIARTFASEGCDLALLARSGDYIASLAEALPGSGAAIAVPTDLADVEAVRAAFDEVRAALGPVDVLVNHASAGNWTGLMDTSVEEFEAAWRVNGRGAFVCSSEAASDMVAAGEGTIIFTGATSAVRGRGGAVGFTAAKFAARGMAMDMAQDLGDEGITVSHVVIDGQILTPRAEDAYPDRDPGSFLDPDEIAETYWHIVERDTRTMPFEVHLTNGTREIEFV